MNKVYEQLKKAVCLANVELERNKLVICNVRSRANAPLQKNYAAALSAAFSGFFQLPGNSSSILSAG